MTALTRSLALGAFVMACASAQTLPPSYVPTQSAISAADAIGARNQPRAALHLKMARDQLAEAEALAKKGDGHEAALMLDRARVDAEMALMVTREAEARTGADRASREVEGLSRGN